MVTCTPSHQGTNRPRKGPNGESSQPTKRAPWPQHKGTMGAIRLAARRAQPRACREGWEVHSSELGLKHSMEALGHTEAKRGQGSVQRTPSRRKQRCQCTGRARQQERGASPVAPPWQLTALQNGGGRRRAGSVRRVRVADEKGERGISERISE
ncbi:hypothetical protein V6N12_035417 [Hibiscus sabdariffa]|uniref:Uncharacterized protein n=1 Tax=Hibiscus sabdariffa TaxID=183260 RepID=A0ABR2EQ41_9ROSI